MKERFPAHIVPKIRTAVERINKNTATHYDFSTREGEKRKTILVFKKLPEAQLEPQPVFQESKKENPFVIPESADFKTLVALLPQERQSQKTILVMLVTAYEKQGLAYVSRNIQYTNKHARKNYRPYLLKALRDDYGITMQEDEDAKRQVQINQEKKTGEEAARKAEESRRQQLEMEAKKLAQNYIAALSPEDRASLERLAVPTITEALQIHVEKKRPGWKIILGLAMEKIATLRLEEAKRNALQPSLPQVEIAE
jgi:hypothetical protein